MDKNDLIKEVNKFRETYATDRDTLAKFLKENTDIGIELMETFVAFSTKDLLNKLYPPNGVAVVTKNDLGQEIYSEGCMMFDIGVFFATLKHSNVEWKGGPTDKELEDDYEQRVESREERY